MKNNLTLFRYFVLGTITLSLASCKPSHTSTPAATEPHVATTVQQTASPALEEENARVSFLVNGVAANTRILKTTDTDKQLGLFNVQNRQLTFDLMGDDPSRPHRGWLHFSINDFELSPATYTLATDNSARFTRYDSENAGGGVDYAAGLNASKGSSMEIAFSAIKKDETVSNERYLVSGTFKATLTLGEFYKNDIKKVEISEGSFQDVPISVLGHR